MSSPIRVLIADDDALVRSALSMMLSGTDDIRVVAEVADGSEVAAAVDAYKPDLVLMDIRMPEMDGLEATRRITADAALSGTRVLVLTTFELDEYVFGALRAGASGFLLKGGEPADLLNAIRIVASGESLLAPSVTRRLIEAYISVPEPGTGAAPGGLDELTARELEVLMLVAGGLSNGEIAAELHLSPLTAKTHVSRILTKLGLRDRVQLVVMAYQAGLVRPSRPGVGR